jgi:hypothetical protein
MRTLDQLAIDEKMALKTWAESPRIPSAPTGYSTNGENDALFQRFINYIDTNPTLMVNTQGLNAAAAVPGIRQGAILVKNFYSPDGQDVRSVTEHFMTARIPSVFKNTNGKLSTDVVSKMLDSIRKNYGSEVSTSTLDAALNEQFGEDRVRKARQDERTINLQQKDHDANSFKQRPVDDGRSEDRAGLKGFIESAAQQSAHQYVESAAVNAMSYRNNRISHGGTADLRAKIRSIIADTSTNDWQTKAKLVKKAIEAA